MVYSYISVLQLISIDVAPYTGNITYEFVVYAVGLSGNGGYLTVEPNYGYMNTEILE